MSARLAGVAIFLIFEVLLSGGCSPAGTIVCPSGTERRAKRVDLDGAVIEWCVNPNSGLKEGPERQVRADGLVNLYTNHHGKFHGPFESHDSEGRLMMEGTYEYGALGPYRMSVVGLKRAMEVFNDTAAKDGNPMRMVVIDEHTIAVDNPVTDWWKDDALRQRFREGFMRGPGACSQFEMGGTGIQTVILRAIDEKKRVVAELPISRDECRAKLSPQPGSERETPQESG